MPQKNIRKTLATCIIFSLLLHTSIAQSKVSFGLGLGTNYSKLFLEKSEVEVKDTYSGQMGLNIIAVRCNLALNQKVNISAQPEIMFTSSKGNLDIKTRLTYFNAPLIYNYKLTQKFGLSAGVYYQRLLKLNLTKDKRSIKFTALANNRNFFNPSLGINYFLNRNVSFEMKGIYSPKSLLNAGAEDFNGNIIDPLKAHNHFISFMIWYKFKN